MDLKRLGARARALIDKRGGTDSVKEDAQELKDIAKGPGSLSDKAKAAADAIKDPGARDAPAGAPSTPAAEASREEGARPEGKVEREARGKHAGGGQGPGQGDQRRQRGGERGV
jgi:hypothetical protein